LLTNWRICDSILRSFLSNMQSGDTCKETHTHTDILHWTQWQLLLSYCRYWVSTMTMWVTVCWQRSVKLAWFASLSMFTGLRKHIQGPPMLPGPILCTRSEYLWVAIDWDLFLFY
jgi:hypothetical protein